MNDYQENQYAGSSSGGKKLRKIADFIKDDDEDRKEWEKEQMSATTNIEQDLSTVAIEIEDQQTTNQSTSGNELSQTCLVGAYIADFVELKTRYNFFKNEAKMTVKEVESLEKKMVGKVHLLTVLAAAAGQVIFFCVKSFIKSNDKLDGVLIGVGMMAYMFYWAWKIYSTVLKEFKKIVDNALADESGFDGAVEDLSRFFKRVRQRPIIPDAAEDIKSINIPASYITQITSRKYRSMVDLQPMKGKLARKAISAAVRMSLAVIAVTVLFQHLMMG